MADKLTANNTTEQVKSDPENLDGVVHRSVQVIDGVSNKVAGAVQALGDALTPGNWNGMEQMIKADYQVKQGLDGGLATKDVMFLDTKKGSLFIDQRFETVEVRLEENGHVIKGTMKAEGALNDGDAPNQNGVKKFLKDFAKAKADGFLSNSEIERLNVDAKEALTAPAGPQARSNEPPQRNR